MGVVCPFAVSGNSRPHGRIMRSSVRKPLSGGRLPGVFWVGEYLAQLFVLGNLSAGGFSEAKRWDGSPSHSGERSSRLLPDQPLSVPAAKGAGGKPPGPARRADLLRRPQNETEPFWSNVKTE